MLKIKEETFVDIKEYQSISETSRQTGITITSISYCANKKRKSGGGYLWHFV